MHRRDFPSIRDLAEILHASIQGWGDGEIEYLDVRLQVVPGEGWSVHTGSPDYDQDHRGYWGAGTVEPGSSMDPTQRMILADVFGEDWAALPEGHKQAIRADILDIQVSEERTFHESTRVLRARIGGPGNLHVYADCLVVGQRRREHPQRGFYRGEEESDAL